MNYGLKIGVCIFISQHETKILSLGVPEHIRSPEHHEPFDDVMYGGSMNDYMLPLCIFYTYYVRLY